MLPPGCVHLSVCLIVRAVQRLCWTVCASVDYICCWLLALLALTSCCDGMQLLDAALDFSFLSFFFLFFWRSQGGGCYCFEAGGAVRTRMDQDRRWIAGTGSGWQEVDLLTGGRECLFNNTFIEFLCMFVFFPS